MDLFISMKAQTILKGLYIDCNLMQMPTAQTEPFFIAEFREDREDQLELLTNYAKILQEKFDGDQDFLIEFTQLGFIIKKKVDENLEYMDEWENWVSFSRKLYEELIDVVGD
ncbi:MAG: hypothetical protein ACRENZ_09715 [Thermodesulfobacteriota bacterium]